MKTPDQDPSLEPSQDQPSNAPIETSFDEGIILIRHRIDKLLEKHDHFAIAINGSSNSVGKTHLSISICHHINERSLPFAEAGDTTIIGSRLPLLRDYQKNLVKRKE